jgi:hypothetical protein
MNVFTFVNAINFDKSELFEDPQAEKDYVPFVVNRALSYFPDTILYANAMNLNQTAAKKWQFDFLKNSIPKRKRFSKWAKKTPHPQDLAAVQSYYKYSAEKALEAMSILSQEQIEYIRQQMGKGGNHEY